MPGRKVALIMGVANPRSIAWACVEHFTRLDWEVIVTCQSPKICDKVEPLLRDKMGTTRILGCFPCDVTTDLEASSGSTSLSSSSLSLFRQRLEPILQDTPLSAVVHCLAHAPNIKTTPLLHTTKTDFLHAQEVSAYSLVQVARQTKDLLRRKAPPPPQQQQQQSGDQIHTATSRSITALSYLGAVRAVPGYHAMGPAKASLESIVRGLALELAHEGSDDDNEDDDEDDVKLRIRVNAVSAGPLPTLSAKGGIAGFDQMRQEMQRRAPLGNVTTDQVASTIQFLSTDAASGITGQTIYVDGGYSIVAGPTWTHRS